MLGVKGSARHYGDDDNNIDGFLKHVWKELGFIPGP